MDILNVGADNVNAVNGSPAPRKVCTWTKCILLAARPKCTKMFQVHVTPYKGIVLLISGNPLKYKWTSFKKNVVLDQVQFWT